MHSNELIAIVKWLIITWFNSITAVEPIMAPLNNDILYMHQRMHIITINDHTLQVGDTFIATQGTDTITNAAVYIDCNNQTIKYNVVMEVNRTDKYIRFNELYFPLLCHKD